MEEMAKRHVEQDEWLKKLYLNTETSRRNHDKIIQSLETKVKTLTNKVEGKMNKAKFEECKAIYMEDGTPLYIPFHYSSKEIEYFSASSGLSDNETQEDEIMEDSKWEGMIYPNFLGSPSFHEPMPLRRVALDV
ncbi:hypothetical protein Tco_0045985 [Tanacetum coccineum]